MDVTFSQPINLPEVSGKLLLQFPVLQQILLKPTHVEDILLDLLPEE